LVIYQVFWIRGARGKGTLRTYPSLRVPTSAPVNNRGMTYQNDEKHLTNLT
jgi:hypothetical protein